MSKKSATPTTDIAQGYKTSDLNNIFGNINALSAENSSFISSPTLQNRVVAKPGYSEQDIKTLGIKNESTADLSSMDPDQLTTLVNIYNRRVAEIQKKKTAPGILMTRGEL